MTKELRELLAGATPGPWKIGPGTHRISNGTEIVCGAWGEYGCGPTADAALIAALRNAAPLLLDVVDGLREWTRIRAEQGPSADATEALAETLARLAALDAAKP